MAPSSARVHVTLVAVQLAFATLSVAGRLILRELDPMALALVRLVGAAVVFSFLARGRRDTSDSMSLRDRAAIAALAAIGIFGNQLFFLEGLRHTTAVHATLLVATIPVFTALVGAAVYRMWPSSGLGKPARPEAWLGIGVALMGVCALVLPDVLASGAGRDAWWGDALVAVNSVLYAVYLVFIGRYATRYGSLRVMAWGFACAALFALPVGFSALVRDAPRLNPSTWVLVAHVTLVATVFTYLGNAWALRFSPSWMVAAYILIQPITAASLAWPVLGEAPSPRLGVAGALVALGLALVVRAEASKLSAPRR